MTTKETRPRTLTAQWRAARRLYPLYAALTAYFHLGSPPYKNLEDIDERSEPEAIKRAGDWLTEMDQRIQVHQLRQFLQTSGLGTSEVALHALLDRHLGKERKTESDRDKIDFLLVQYFAICAPPSFHEGQVELDEVAEVLEPVLGECATHTPDWLKPLEKMTSTMQELKSLDELRKHRVIERGRQLKFSSGEMYFGSTALLAFTRFNYLVRRTFFRLLNTELQTIKEGLRELEARGTRFLDCTSVQLSAQEPIANLQQLCQNFKKPLICDYSADRSFERLLGLRSLIENALAPRAIPPKEAPKLDDGDLQGRLQEISRQLAELRGLVVQVLAHSEEKESVPPSTPASPKAATSPDPEETQPVPTAAASLPSGPPATPAPGSTTKSTKSAHPHAISSMGVTDCVEWIKEQLLPATRKKGVPTGGMAVGSTLLTAGEVSAFLDRPDSLAALVQRAIAVRVLLIDALDVSRRTGQAANLSSLLSLARDASAELQEASAQSQKAKNITDVETLKVATRQLLTVIAYAEKAAR